MNQEIIIKPKSPWMLVDIDEIIRYRELFYIFAWRDLKVRYKQTVLGAFWAVFQPLSQTFVFTVFFGNLAGIPSGELPYPIFVLTGLVFWGFFSGVTNAASGSLIENENIVKKVYFPRMILPLSKIVVGSVDFIISFVLFLIALMIFGVVPSTDSFWVIPYGFVVSSVAASGLGLLLSAVNVKYRDVRYALPFFLQLLIFVTPVIYPSNAVRPSLQLVIALNPMTGVIESIRAAVSGANIDMFTLGISTLAAIVIFIVGLIYFRSTEKFFADIV